MNVTHNLFQSDNEIRNFLGDFIVSRPSDGNYLERLVIVWDEKRMNGVEIQNIQHVFAVGIDRKNQVFMDCSKRLIYAKILISTLLRPSHTAFLIFYQLSMIPIFKAISLVYSNRLIACEASKQSLRSIVDIVRIPLYELAMVIAGCAALLIAPFAPTTLYRFRELIGKIEKAMFYDVLHHSHSLTSCFQPLSLMELVGDYGFDERENKMFSLSRRENTNYGHYESSTRAIVDRFYVRNEQNNLRISPGHLQNLDDSQPEIKQLFQRIVTMRAVMHYGRAIYRGGQKRGCISRDEVYRSFVLAKIDLQTIERIRFLWRRNPFVSSVSEGYDLPDHSSPS